MLNRFQVAVISQEIGTVVRVLKFQPECMTGIIGVNNFQFAVLCNRKIEIVNCLLNHPCIEQLKQHPQFNDTLKYCISELQKRYQRHSIKGKEGYYYKCYTLLQTWYEQNFLPQPNEICSLNNFKTQLYHEIENEMENMSRINIFKYIFKRASEYTGINPTDKNITPTQKEIFDYAKELVRKMMDNSNIQAKKILTAECVQNESLSKKSENER